MTELKKPVPNQKLRYERERRGWSQQEVADRVGTTPLNVGRWERGVTIPGPHFRVKLSEIFGKSPSELGFVSERPPRLPFTGSSLSLERTIAAPEPQTPYWNVPYNRNHFFTGREDILAHLHDALLNDGQPVALTQPQAISGLGGIGKTQTAVEYAYRYRENYRAVLWARADSPDLLTSDLLTIAVLLNLPQRNEQEQSVVVKAALHWFDTHEGWLLILDNADHLEEVNEFLPSADKGHVLLTTRAHSTGTIAQRIELEKMGLEEGMLFLLRRMKRLKGTAELESVPESVRNQAQAIVEAVDGLPLALDQAGAYIEETGCSLSDYLKFYKTRRNRLLRIRGRSTTGHPEPVATTWSLSFEKVEQANPAAAELLRLCAFLHPDEIPEAMIIEGASELGSLLQSVAEDEMEMNEAIGELRKYSLVKRDPELKLLNIHRLVQVVIKDAMDKEMARKWAEQTVRMVNKAFPEVEFATWPICQQYLPHIQVCAELIIQWEMRFAEAAWLLNMAGQYLQDRGQYAEAESLLQFARTVGEQLPEPNLPYVADILCNLGLVYDYQGKCEQAEQIYQHAIAIFEPTLYPDQSEMTPQLKTLCSLYNNLGVLYSEQGKYKEAEPLLQRTRALREQALGSEDLIMAHSLNNLGRLYLRQAKYDQAKLFLQRALAIRERELGSEHPHVAYSLSGLALLYFDQGKYDQAAHLFQRILTIREQSLGSMHLLVAQTLNDLAMLYSVRNQYTEAEQLFQRSIAIKESTIGLHHWELALSLQGVADLYRKQGKHESAELLYQRAYSIHEQSQRKEHPDAADILRGKALLRFDRGKYTEAEQLFYKALAINERSLGSEHPNVARILNDLATLHKGQSNYEQVEALLQRALLIYERSSIPEHPDAVSTMENYIKLLRKTGREAEAIKLEERAHAIRAGINA